MMDSLDLADTIITIDYQFNGGVTNLRLQKYLYYLNLFYMLEHDGQPIIKDDFYNWIYGPTIPDVYDEYERWGGDVITKPEKHLVDITNSGLVFRNFDIRKINPDLINFVIDGCQKLKDFATFDLVKFAQSQPEFVQSVRPGSFAKMNQDTAYYFYQKPANQFWKNLFKEEL